MERTLSLPAEVSHRLPLLVVAAGVIALGRAALATGGRTRGWLLALAGLTFLAGGGIAVFHVGVEQGWWEGTAQCGATGKADSIEALRAQIMAAPLVRCTDIAWSFAGISMAGFNVIASAILAAVTLAGARRLIRDDA
jgi:disulfide bond formation protein DsbB